MLVGATTLASEDGIWFEENFFFAEDQPSSSIFLGNPMSDKEFYSIMESFDKELKQTANNNIPSQNEYAVLSSLLSNNNTSNGSSAPARSVEYLMPSARSLITRTSSSDMLAAATAAIMANNNNTSRAGNNNNDYYVTRTGIQTPPTSNEPILSRAMAGGFTMLPTAIAPSSVMAASQSFIAQGSAMTKNLGGDHHSKKRSHHPHRADDRESEEGHQHVSEDDDDDFEDESRISRRKKSKRQVYRGVTFDAASKKFRARIKLDGKTTHIGYFKTAHAAAIAFDKQVVAHRGSTRAKTNFPIENYTKESHSITGYINENNPVTPPAASDSASTNEVTTPQENTPIPE